MPGQFLMDAGVDFDPVKRSAVSDLLRDEGIPHVIVDLCEYSISFPSVYWWDVEDLFRNAGIEIDDIGPNDEPHHTLQYDGWVRTKEKLNQST